MRYMLLLYENTDTRDAFFGPGGEPLGAEIDELRGEEARRRREELFTEAEAPVAATGLGLPAYDDTLALLLLCCHKSLTVPSQIALTLRAVGGLTTAEIASAFLVPEATTAQRISRAKTSIRAAGAVFEPPADAAGDTRLGSVRHVLYLMFNEGCAAGSGTRMQRVELAEEAIRLTRTLQCLLPADDEVRGHLLELAGDTAAAAAAYDLAARLTTSLPEHRYLQRRAVAARTSGGTAKDPARPPCHGSPPKPSSPVRGSTSSTSPGSAAPSH